MKTLVFVKYENSIDSTKFKLVHVDRKGIVNILDLSTRLRGGVSGSSSLDEVVSHFLRTGWELVNGSNQ